MKKILIRPQEIESCWEKNDACFVKMKSGKVWICERDIFLDIPDSEFKYHINTLEQIAKSQNDKLVEIYLIDRGEHYGK